VNRVNVKVKWSRYRPGLAQRVGRGIALLFHDRGTWRGWVFSSTPQPHFTPGKTRYPFYRKLGGPQGRFGRAENLVPTGIRSRTVQPLVSRYTDWANRPTVNIVNVKCSRYRPGLAQRVGRGIALLFHDRGTRRGWVFSSTPGPHFTPGNTRYPFYRRLSGPQGRSGRAENLVPTGIRSRTAQPIDSRYTDWANRPTVNIVKVKCSRYRPGVAQGVGRDIALLFHDRGTRRGEWSAALPVCTLPPGKTRYPFYRSLGEPQGRSGMAENLVPTGIRSRTVQPVVSRYTDWANQSTVNTVWTLI